MERSDDEEMVTPMNFFLGILCAWACAFTGVAHVDEHVLGGASHVDAHVDAHVPVDLCIFF